MSARRLALFAAVIAAPALGAILFLRAGSPARLIAVGPRVISNQTDYPVMIWGEGLEEGMSLVIGGAKHPTKLIDDRHLTARIPAGIEVLPELTSVELTARLETRAGTLIDGEAGLTLINDTRYPRPYALEALGDQLVIASPTTDELHVIGTKDPIPTRDQPRALAAYLDRKGKPQLAVAHQRGELTLAATSTRPQHLRVAPDLQDLAIDHQNRLAYLTSHTLDRVLIVDLDRAQPRGSLPAGINPRALAIGESGSLAIVANQLSQDISIIDLSTQTEKRVRPGPGASIIGGHTEKYRNEIMGDTPARAIAYDDAQHVAFVANLGPNIGPNRDRMEVTMESGVAIIDARNAKYLRHVSILGGVAEALALDPRKNLLYVADSATGRIVVFDSKKLVESDESARAALKATLLLPHPEGTPAIRPAEDFGVQGRATAALHFGPRAIRLDANRARLWVLSQFSGAVAEIDTSAAENGALSIVKTHPGWVGSGQAERRRGEIIYFTDLGNSRMTCDTCHPEGHVGGIMFSKGALIRIYRAPTVRAIRESPPYFTPARLSSIRRTAKDVLARNRFNNPIPTNDELDALTEFTGSVAILPNPYLSETGELPRALVLPDGATGDAVRGLNIFEGKGGCAGERCHPPPSFTADQSKATRGLFHRLGTPVALMLRPELQDLKENFGQPAPSLLGVWDIFPLFLSGAGGNSVAADGTIVADHPFALRWMLENPEWAAHGHGPSLSAAERNDLLAYLLTL